MDFIMLVGYVAGIFTTFSYLPELIDTIKTKDVKDISVGWLTCLGIGLALWTYYGLLINSNPLLILSAISFVFAIMMLGLKFKYSKK